MPLSDAQTLILTAAAQHPDGFAMPPASSRPALRAAVAKVLLRAGLLAPAGAKHNGASAAWRPDGGIMVLRITEAGLRAIGIEQQSMPAQTDGAVQEAPAMTMPADRDSESLTAAGTTCVFHARQPADAAQGASPAPHGHRRGPTCATLHATSWRPGTHRIAPTSPRRWTPSAPLYRRIPCWRAGTRGRQTCTAPTT